jgi:hypothetical protein
MANALQVLPPAGDMSAAWPRLLGKCLFAYSGGATPAIRTLIIEDYYDQILDDVLECWASCMWSVQAILCACSRYPEYKDLMAGFQKLSTTIYTLVCLRQDEFFDDRINRTL